MSFDPFDFIVDFPSAQIEEYSPPSYPHLVRYNGSGLGSTITYYSILRRTPCGVWIAVPGQKEKFVNQKVRKQWAWPTREEARKSFFYRKMRQEGILRTQLKNLNLLLDQIEKEWGFKARAALAAMETGRHE